MTGQKPPKSQQHMRPSGQADLSPPSPNGASSPRSDDLPAMGRARQTAIGFYLTGIGLALLAATTWAWSLASSLTEGAGESGARRVHFLGFGFTPTPAFSLLLLVVLSAMAASVAIVTVTFAQRAGRHTVTAGWEWWYITRPVIAGVVGVVAYTSLLAGFFAWSISDRPQAVVASAVGGLAGLFTDRVVRGLGRVADLTEFDKRTGSHQRPRGR